ncbi:hypothetical protein FNU79_14775 [Deinococcus detaillensis]|uniref:Uncharacterized protein n=1 Tax=Deinococcus detaillensis TaxID=2592048 RepID=A0A553UND1_9DEIO|nr:hypothetical protein [Deinococcus detaillensis]TSA81713.1 hypothetical protein FNU79_14775 [Deinococcus detaillensis]
MNRMLMVLPLLIGSAFARPYSEDGGFLELAAARPPLVTCEAGKTMPCVVMATQISDMAGVWRQYLSSPDFTTAGGMGYVHFSADGTFALADTQEHAAAASFSPFPHGTYSFEGNRMTINVENPPPSMPECARSVQEVLVVKMGDQKVAMTFMPIEDACKPRLSDTGQVQLYIGPPQ